MKVVAVAGGTGSAKLLRGLQRLPLDLTAVVNDGDNVWMYGAYVCPDVDIATSTLAGVADPGRGWGIEGATFKTMDRLSKLGAETWFRVGDLDLATCLFRTQLMRQGATLTEATDRVRRALGVKSPVLPLSDSDVATYLDTPRGWMHLQEFWVRERGRPAVNGVAYRGARGASVTAKVRAAVLGADRVVICPANPVTSVGPMLAVPGVARLLREPGARVVALSPLAGRVPFSGPAAKLLKAVGARPDSVGVAKLYRRFLDALLIADGDAALRPTIESMGIRCATSDTLM